MANRQTIQFNAKITPIKPLNDEFTLCKCYIMALDKNRNWSYISKDAADAALPTLFNIPVIGHLIVDDEGNYRMGGHDQTIVKDEDGSFRFKSLCVPYGVVPQQESVHYEDVAEPSGDVKTYLVSDVILWTGRFPELKESIYDENVFFGQSMEINVTQHAPLEEDKNYTNILEYTYSALCLLGKSDNPEYHTEPCFPMAHVEPYEFSFDDDKFSELMSQLKSDLAFCFDSATKGGETMEETVVITPEEQAVAVEAGFEAKTETEIEVLEDGATSETTEEIVPEEVANIEVFASSEDGVSTENQEDATDIAKETHGAFSATYRDRHDALREAMPYINEVDENGDEIRNVGYYVRDFDDNYVYVERGEWTREDGYSETLGRFGYAYDEDSKSATLTSDFEKMVVKWLTPEEAQQVEAMRGEYEALLAYKDSREKSDREAEFDAVVGEFSDLEGNEEFGAICDARYSYESVDALRNACYIVRGKFSVRTPQRKSAAEPSIPVGVAKDSETPLQRLHARFGKK